MSLKILSVILPSVFAAAILGMKILLDFHLAVFLVKWFHWLPVRGSFRTKVPDISGDWDQEWEVRSKSFPETHDRSGLTKVYQLNKYCFAEFVSKGVEYRMFGKIKEEYLVGEWYDKNSDQGYYGAFEIEIIDTDTLMGKWIGHSKTRKGIKAGDWEWKRNHSSLKL